MHPVEYFYEKSVENKEFITWHWPASALIRSKSLLLSLVRIPFSLMDSFLY